MPTYEYACKACGHQFEEFQSIKAKPITVCPRCKKRKVKRLISAGAGFIFKGSGFYITDYRSESYKSAAKSESGESTKKTDTPASTPAKTTTETSKSATPAASASATPPAKPKSK